MATLKESGEAWIAAGQDEYGQMLVDADAAIERQAKELHQMQDAGQNEIGMLRQERDAALVEVESYKNAFATGGARWVARLP